MRALFYVLIVYRFQQATFDRGNDAGQFVSAFQYLAVLTEERPHAGRFSIRACGLSAARRKAAKTATSRVKSMA